MRASSHRTPRCLGGIFTRRNNAGTPRTRPEAAREAPSPRPAHRNAIFLNSSFHSPKPDECPFFSVRGVSHVLRTGVEEAQMTEAPDARHSRARRRFQVGILTAAEANWVPVRASCAGARRGGNPRRRLPFEKSICARAGIHVSGAVPGLTFQWMSHFQCLASTSPLSQVQLSFL